MALSKPYTSDEVAQLVEHWQFCQFFDMANQRPLITIPSHELYKKDSRLRCSPEALEKIKTTLTKEYNEGMREVGMICPPLLRIELVDLALTVTEDPNWKIYPCTDPIYARGVLDIQEKIWTDALVPAAIETQISMVERGIAAQLGFTDDVLDELMEHINTDKLEDLPEHLRVLFADAEINPKKE